MESPSITPGYKTKKKVGLIIVSTITLLVLVVGLAAGLALVGKTQIFRQKAAVSGGVAKIYLSPEEKTISQGDTFSVKIYFDTSTNAISAMTVQLSYNYSGSEPPISVTEVTLNQSLPVEAMWDFPVKSFSSNSGQTLIKIAGFSGSIDGYQSSGQVELATINFKGNSPGTINVTFDQSQSIMTKKSDGVDILLIPQSTGTYTVGGNNPTSTPTPTPTPTSSTVVIEQPVPQTGIPAQTLLGLGSGLILIIASVLLAI